MSRWAWLRVVVLALVATSALAAASVRDALREQSPPWYDAERDGWRRMGPPLPAEPEAASRPAEGEPADSERWSDGSAGDGRGGERGEYRESSGRSSSGLGPEVGAGIGTLMYVLLIIAVVALVVWIVITIIRERSDVPPRDERRGAGADRGEADLDELPFAAPSARDPRREREAAWARGDWSAWVVWHYACLLLWLDRSGVIELRRDQTNRGYLRQAAAHPGPGRLLAEVVPVFERTWFGGVPVDAETAARLRAEEANWAESERASRGAVP